MGEFWERLTAYQIAVSTARKMLRDGIISEEEYHKIDTIMAEKYGVSLDSIFR